MLETTSIKSKNKINRNHLVAPVVVPVLPMTSSMGTCEKGTSNISSKKGSLKQETTDEGFAYSYIE